MLFALLTILAAFFLRVPEIYHETITHRIGKFDERFGLIHQEADYMWEKPMHKELFREDKQAVIEVNLIYDYQQKASEKLKKLNFKIDKTKASYDDLKTRLENLKTEYNQKNNTGE